MSVEKDFGQNIPPIISDKDQMQEVLVALILNSLDSVSSKPKGGKLTIKTGYLKDKGLVEIILTDTGIGINQDDLKRLGEPFFSAKTSGKGAGLGLATAWGIVERYNGKINIQSNPGEGAEFIISLPVVEPEKEQLI